jgi:hypothetical protein
VHELTTHILRFFSLVSVLACVLGLYQLGHLASVPGPNTTYDTPNSLAWWSAAVLVVMSLIVVASATIAIRVRQARVRIAAATAILVALCAAFLAYMSNFRL